MKNMIIMFRHGILFLKRLLSGLKIYIEIPFLDRYEKIDGIPIYVGFGVSWSKYNFRICDSKAIFPNGMKEGRHKFRLSLRIMYFSISFIIYKPEPYV